MTTYTVEHRPTNSNGLSRIMPWIVVNDSGKEVIESFTEADANGLADLLREGHGLYRASAPRASTDGA